MTAIYFTLAWWGITAACGYLLSRLMYRTQPPRRRPLAGTLERRR